MKQTSNELQNLEQNGLQDHTKINRDYINFFYFFSGASIFIYSTSFDNFWKLASYFQFFVFALNLVFVLTPLWKKIYNYDVLTSKKNPVWIYVYIYSMHALFLISQIGALIKLF